MKNKKMWIAVAVLFISNLCSAIENDEPNMPVLGINATEITKDVFVKFFKIGMRIPRRQGVLILSVQKDSPAEIAGLKALDIILNVNNKKIITLQDFTSTMANNGIKQFAIIDILSPVGKDTKLIWKQSQIKVLPVYRKDLENQSQQDEFPLYLNVVGGILRISFEYTHIYLFADEDKRSEDLNFSFMYKDSSGKVHHSTADYFDVNGQPMKITYESDNTEIVSFDKKDLKYSLGDVTFEKPGTANIVITFAGTVVKVPITVIRLPFNRNTPAEEIIKQLGLPDEEKNVIECWPDTSTVDNIIYSPSASERCISRKHWRYKQFTEAVFAITTGTIQDKTTRVVEIGLSPKRDIWAYTEENLRWLSPDKNKISEIRK